MMVYAALRSKGDVDAWPDFRAGMNVKTGSKKRKRTGGMLINDLGKHLSLRRLFFFPEYVQLSAVQEISGHEIDSRLVS